jgi:hypothetical protein
MKAIREIYLAAGLFNAADRHRNLLLAEGLRKLGYNVILPQLEAIKYFKDGKFDLLGLCEHCAEQAIKSDVVVANIDGSDADSGTSLEVGLALHNKFFGGSDSLVICYRTDFRTAPEQELGVNAMFQLAHKIIYKPAYFNSLLEAEKFYEELAQVIDAAIKSLF